MKIYLFDIKKKEDVEVTFNVECVLPSPDLFVAFVNKDEVCGLMNMNDSAPYDEFYFRKINHIIQGNTFYEGRDIELTVGFYLSENIFQAFLIEHKDSFDQVPFQSSTWYDENYYRDHFIFNYAEYAQLQVVGLEMLSFDEYVKKLVNERIDRSQNLLYNIHKGNKEVKNYASIKGWSLFMEEEELNNKTIQE